MPRGPRIDFPGAMHHVYARGIEKRAIFLDDSDRIFFLEKVGANLPRWGIRCHAWALMPNHFHLLLRSTEGQLPSFMSSGISISTRCVRESYARWRNWRIIYGRVIGRLQGEDTRDGRTPNCCGMNLAGDPPEIVGFRHTGNISRDRGIRTQRVLSPTH
jgi:REP element-mobilizing transposase RayT